MGTALDETPLLLTTGSLLPAEVMADLK